MRIKSIVWERNKTLSGASIEIEWTSGHTQTIYEAIIEHCCKINSNDELVAIFVESKAYLQEKYEHNPNRIPLIFAIMLEELEKVLVKRGVKKIKVIQKEGVKNETDK